MASPPPLTPRDYPPPPRGRPSPTLDSERKRHRVDSPDGVPRRGYRDRDWDRDRNRDRDRDRERDRDRDRHRDRDSHDRSGRYTPAKRPAPYAAAPAPASASAPAPTTPAYDRRPHHGYQNGFGAVNGVRPAVQPPQNSKSRRLYIGNIPFQAGLTDVALTQFFSALYIAGMRPNLPGECLPVVSFWLHSDGKFGFMELRGEQEAVNMMQFNGIFLHGRPLRVNRPSDYKPELHNPSAMALVPENVNVRAVMDLCAQLGGIVAAPAQLAAVAAAQGAQSHTAGPPSAIPSHPASSVSPSYSAPLPPHTPADVARSPALATGRQEQRPQSSQRSTAARVVSLRNLVTDEDLDGNDQEYQEILDDVRTECSNYGRVRSVNIPRSGLWKGSAFVEFSSESEARRGLEGLGQKVFDGRKIVAVIVHGCETATEAASRPPPS